MMAVETTDLSKRYSCNGVNKNFPITFEYLDTAALLDVKLYSTSLGTYTTLALTTHYTVAADTVTTVATYAAGYDILLRLDFEDLITQGTDWVENDKFTSGSWETALDRVTLICQWLAEGLSRCVQGPFADADAVSWVIGETASERASGYLQFSADGLSIGVATGSVPSTATVTAFAETLLDDTSASAFLSTLGLSGFTLTAFAKTLTDDTSASAFLSTLGVSAFIQTLLDEASAASARTVLSAIASSDSITGTAAGVKETGASLATIKTQIVAISNWDMDTVGTVNVETGINRTTWRDIQVLIKIDSDVSTATYGLTQGFGASYQGGWYSNNASETILALTRVSSGDFDSGAFNATPYNRGWVTIQYTA